MIGSDSSALLEGACIGVVSPAGAVSVKRQEAGLEALKQLGFEPRLVPLESGACAHYLAATDEQRSDQLTRAIEDPSLDAVWCLRGGYGSMRTLARIDPMVLSRLRKPLIGFSDISILLLALSGMGGRAVHGPVVAQLPNLNAESLHQVQQMLAGQSREIHLLDEGDVLTPGVAEGPLMGGNLSLLVSAIGTRWQPNLTGCILFLEDIGEPAYRVDRMFTQLRHSGLLEGLKGVALGHFSGMAAGDKEAMDQLFLELASWIDGPVVTGLPVGHESSNVAIPLGALACLDTSSFRLTLLDPPSAVKFA